MEWWYSRTRRWIDRGYLPLAEPTPSPEWVVLPPTTTPALLVFCPTIVALNNERSQRDTITHLVSQLAASSKDLPTVLLMVGMQHLDEWPASATATERLSSFASLAKEHEVQFCAFRMTCFGKVRSLNVALKFAREHDALGLLQVDDDVRLDDQCLVRLVTEFCARGRRGAVGARKVPASRPGSIPQLLHWLKKQTRPACNYPHACCLMINPQCIPEEIPPRFVSDDGYICFSLLRPDEPDPWHLLHIVPDARCFYFVGGDGGRSLLRIRRLLLNHHINLVSFPTEVCRFYFREILFPGFWPLGASIEPGIPRAWFLQLTYFGLFVLVGLELAIRGTLGLPIRKIAWAGPADRSAPEATGPRAARL